MKRRFLSILLVLAVGVFIIPPSGQPKLDLPELVHHSTPT
jgi:hypothetical protein